MSYLKTWLKEQLKKTEYKGQYGTEGLSGLMFASVDENKFKQEVAKLLEPAINDITTKMDEKFKEIQNAVGGITKTA